MRRGYRFLLTLTAVVAAGLAAIEPAFAQGSSPRFEVGGQLGALRLSDFAATNIGLGGRASIDLARWVSLEGEYTFFPHDDITVVSTFGPSGNFGIGYERRRSEASIGPKMGVRGQRVGLFGKVRPGFTRLTHRGVECRGDVCALVLLAIPEYRTEFALDLGGVLEYYPSARRVLRFDVGSTVVHHRSSAPPCAGERCTSSNFSSGFGVGVRF